MYHISFVILHYISYPTTLACIDSILNNYAQTDEITYDIIVVDNGSPNQSLVELKNHYAVSPSSHLHFIKSDTNLGFANGNNLGYQYALQTLKADFVIFANNDTEFHQKEFLSGLVKTYNSNSHPALIGPDIYNIHQFHQSPYRDHIITKKEINRWIRNRSLWLTFLRVDRHLHLSDHISFFQNYYERRSASARGNSAWNTVQKQVVLQGACIIATPVFIETFRDYAFYPETFMYCEEDIIAYLCDRKQLHTLYTPELQVLHKEAVSTSLSISSSSEKEIFLSENIISSLRILKRLYTHPFES